MATQLEIDWTRARQLALLRDVVLPDRQVDCRVSGKLQKAVLRTIDDHARGGEAWLGFERIAAEAGCSVRSAKRAVEALTAASVLITETRRSPVGVVVNHYLIVWTELDLLPRVPSARTSPVRSTVTERSAASARQACPDFESPVLESSPERSAVVTERSAVASERSAVATLAECRGDTQTAPTFQKRIEPPPPTPSKPKPANGGGGGWDLICQEWRSRISQIQQIAAEARAAGETAGDFLARLQAAWEMAVHPANRDRVRKPAGAVVHWLRQGTWPVDGLIDPQDAQALQAATQRVERRSAEVEWQQTQAVLYQVVKAGRQAGASEDEIRAALLRRASAADVARFGW